MPAGYSGTPLPKKIGLKEGDTLLLLNAPTGIASEFMPLPDGALIHDKATASFTLAVLFCPTIASLKMHVGATAQKLHADGALWISWPKKASPLFQDLTEDIIRDVILPMGLVDVKVCAINSDWSGLKLMVRKEFRADWSQKRKK
jgi:hypothetical protein